LLTKEEILRYDRQIKVKSFGVEGQLKLKQAKVLVIGAGGLGCPALQYMAAAGVGQIHIVDGDIVGESNLQRQLLFNTNDLGQFKAETAAIKLKLINPFIQISFKNQFLSAKMALDTFKEFDLIMDCCDNFGTRYLINDVCLLYNLPFVSSSLYQREAQLGVFNVAMNDGNYSAAYSDVYPENNKSASSLDCNAAGVTATLPGIMGVLQANEAIKYFTDKNNCILNQLLLLNSTTLETIFIAIEKSQNPKSISRELILGKLYEIPCSTASTCDIDNNGLKQILQNNYKIIDVREFQESPSIKNDSIVNIPLSVLENCINEIAGFDRIVFVCKSGIRSKKAVEMVSKKLSNKQLYSYKFGIEELIKVI